MKTLTSFLFSKTIGRFFCLLGLYFALIVNSQAAGFVDISGISVSELPVTIGQNFNINFSLQEYRFDSKNFEYIEVRIRDRNNRDIYQVKQWDSVSFSAGQTLDFSATTYLYSNRSPGDYFIVVRGKTTTDSDSFDFGVVPYSYASYTTNPYQFTAISPIKNAGVVYSNYGPENSVCTGCQFWFLFTQNPTGESSGSIGMPFTVPAGSNFDLESISITLFNYGRYSPQFVSPTVLVSVIKDNGGVPDVLEQFTFSNFHDNYWNNPVLLTGVSVNHPKLTAGTQYWLTAKMGDPISMQVGWTWNDQSVTGPIASCNNSYCSTRIVDQSYLGAFRIMGTPTSNPQKLQPKINSISPDSGLAGTSVTIKGNRFGATQEGSFVRFGSVQAVVNSWSDNKIEAVAPSGPNGSVPVSVMTAVGISNVNKMFAYNIQPNITLNIQRVPILKKQDFKNYEVQLQYELLDVASSETQKLGGDCYTGVMSAIAVNQAGQIAKLALSTIASGIIEASIGLITTANLYGDYLLKFSANIAGSLIQENPFDEAVIKFIAENTMGYIAGKATNNFYAGEFIEELNQSVVEKLLKNDGGLNWVVRGNNKNSRYYTSKLVPLTEVDSQFYYNPYTHYTTGIVRATCYPEGSSMRKQLYTISYLVDETKYHSAEIVAGTLVIRLMNLN